jgi:hypothetical protein
MHLDMDSCNEDEKWREMLLRIKLNFQTIDAPLKRLFIVALLKLLKVYPYTCFDPRIIVRVFFLKATVASVT